MRGTANDDSGDPRAKRREYERLYRERNRERLRERYREWAKQNPDRVAAKQKRYAQTEKGRATSKRFAESEKKRAALRLRRQREARATGHATEEQLAWRAAMWGFRCWVCSGPWNGVMDHVIPVALGGSHWPANRRPICKTCNERKWAKHPRAFVSG